jgi:hypothetical protein
VHEESICRIPKDGDPVFSIVSFETEKQPLLSVTVTKTLVGPSMEEIVSPCPFGKDQLN